MKKIIVVFLMLISSLCYANSFNTLDTPTVSGGNVSLPFTWTYDGDQQKMGNTDQSKFYVGGWAKATGTLSGLLGGGDFFHQYWCHNVATNQTTGVISATDDATSTSYCYGFTDAGLWTGFQAPAGATAVFNATAPISFNLLTGYGFLTGPLAIGSAINYTNFPGTVGSFIGASASGGYIQTIVQDTTASGQACYVANANDATDTTHYGQLCMNNSTSPGVSNVFFPNIHAMAIYSTDSEVDIASLGAGGVVNIYAASATTPTMIVSSSSVTSNGSIIAASGITSTAASNSFGATVFSGAITGGQAATFGATSVTTLSATGTATLNSSGVGTITQTYTGNAGYFGLYSTGVTPGNTNFSLVSNGSLTQLNGLASSVLTVGSTAIATATSTGLAVTGTLSATGMTLDASGNLLLSGTPGIGALAVSSTVASTSTTGATDYFLKLQPSYNQTGSAAATDIYLNRTGTTGSGSQYLMQLNVAGVDKFHVDSTGAITTTGNITTGSSIISAAGTLLGVKAEVQWWQTVPTGRAVNTSTNAIAIPTSISTSYLSGISASGVTITLATPAGDGERRRIVFGGASTGITWAFTAPATAQVGLPTTVVAGQVVEIVYNSVAGTPANSAATTWYQY